MKALALVLLTTLLSIFSPSAASAAPSACTSSRTNAWHTHVWSLYNQAADDRFRERLNYENCSGGVKVLHSYRLSVRRYGTKKCDGPFANNIQFFRMNPSPLAGTNPSPHTWDCKEGKSEYVKWVDLGDLVMLPTTVDRCFSFSWKIGLGPALEDKSGTSNTRCLS